VPGLHLVYNGPDAMIYANDDSLPRTWLVTGQDVVKGDKQALTKIVSSGFDPRRAVVTERPLPGLSEHEIGSAAPGNARITHYGAEQVEISARANSPAELVLSDTSYPGWQVTVNGRPAQISRVDYLLRGVAVPAGNDRIVFTYNPTSFRNGWLVSLVAAVATVTAIVITLVGRRRWRSRGRHARSRS
jgi:Bacterial membrane protein YfhO